MQTQQPTQALEHLYAALTLAEGIGSCTEQSWLHSGLAQAHRLAGDPSQAADHGRQAFTLAQMCGRAYDQELARLALARLAQGDG